MVKDWITRFDLYLLKLLNVDWANPVLDQFWLLITQLHKHAWFQYGLAPVVLLILFYIYRLQTVKLLVALGLAIGLADTIAYRGIKGYADRERPFQNEEITWVRKVGEAHGKSFPSNHAANVFAAVAVLSWYFPRGRKGFYIFAILVGMSRTALGVHYPTDVIAGAALGIFVGFFVRFFLLNRYAWFRMAHPRTKKLSRRDQFMDAR